MNRYSSYTEQPYGALMFDDRKDYEAFIVEMSAVAAAQGEKAGVALHNRALAYWEIGEADRALSDFDAAIPLLARDGMPNHMKAMLLRSLERTEAAIQSAENAVRINPKAATSRRLLAQLLISVGRLQEALPHYTAAVMIEPSFVQTRVDLRELKERIRAADPNRRWWKLW